DWYRRVLAPEGCDLKHFAYLKGSCPRAEKAAEETVNLPTHIQMTEEKAKRVVDFIKEYFPPSHQS
ncbi:MAG: DegT/DnrJ/EryC1/StrS family aminotransferase, partial [Candidatus Gracilibacteria bacterium]|nr:DegT/DnrJ/EryC1/StrS family aminotransferase [Candidatus Gracilibacteria bacterium]